MFYIRENKHRFAQYLHALKIHHIVLTIGRQFQHNHTPKAFNFIVETKAHNITQNHYLSHVAKTMVAIKGCRIWPTNFKPVKRV